MRDHLGNNNVVARDNGQVVQNTYYFPYGKTIGNGESYNPGAQPYKFGGKEEEPMFGLGLYDFHARQMDQAVPRFMSIDPLAEKYYSISPYVYCLNNPIIFIDPNGKDVKPADEESLQMIRNTLTTEDMQYVQFDKNGFINKDLFNSHKSESGNFNALSGLVNSDILTEVSIGSGFTYLDNEGNLKTETFTYQEADSEFADLTGSTMGGTTTGEAGYMGQTLLPGKGKSGMNSPDNAIKVYINKSLSSPARSELYSHEANGHALIYVQTGSREKAAHQSADGKWIETNMPLLNNIIKSKQETIKNMNGR